MDCHPSSTQRHATDSYRFIGLSIKQRPCLQIEPLPLSLCRRVASRRGRYRTRTRADTEDEEEEEEENRNE